MDDQESGLMKRWRLRWLSVPLVALGMASLACAVTEIGAPFSPSPVPAPGTPATPGSVLTPEAEIAGLLTSDGEEHRYTFHGEAGLAVSIDMRAPGGGMLDSYVELVGPSGQVLTTDDDSGSGLNSLISSFILPETGDYTIVSHSYNFNSQGSYSLFFQIGTPVPTPTALPTAEPGGGPIAVGGTLTGNLNADGQVDQWMFEAHAGDIVTISMRSSTPQYLDSFLELVSPSGLTLVVDDDNGTGLDAQIANYVLPEDGTYTIRASGLNNSRGAYNITLQVGQPPTPTPPPPTPGPSPTPFDREVSLGDVVEGRLMPSGAGDRFEFLTDEPQIIEVEIQVLDGPADLQLSMRQPGGGPEHNLVDFGNGSSLFFLPNVYLPTAGRYVFTITTAEAREVAYTFSINLSEIATTGGGQIAYGQGVSGELLFPNQQDYWTFEGQAGDVITIIMNGINLDSYLALRNQHDVTLTQNDDVEGSGSLNARISNFVLPSDGTYTIVASSFRSNSYGPYRLELFEGTTE
jgi:hypothetical protein